MPSALLKIVKNGFLNSGHDVKEARAEKISFLEPLIVAGDVILVRRQHTKPLKKLKDQMTSWSLFEIEMWKLYSFWKKNYHLESFLFQVETKFWNFGLKEWQTCKWSFTSNHLAWSLGLSLSVYYRGFIQKVSSWLHDLPWIHINV